jgi:hypothetical protein
MQLLPSYELSAEHYFSGALFLLFSLDEELLNRLQRRCTYCYAHYTALFLSNRYETEHPRGILTKVTYSNKLYNRSYSMVNLFSSFSSHLTENTVYFMYCISSIVVRHPRRTKLLIESVFCFCHILTKIGTSCRQFTKHFLYEFSWKFARKKTGSSTYITEESIEPQLFIIRFIWDLQLFTNISLCDYLRTKFSAFSV